MIVRKNQKEIRREGRERGRKGGKRGSREGGMKDRSKEESSKKVIETCVSKTTTNHNVLVYDGSFQYVL